MGSFPEPEYGIHPGRPTGLKISTQESAGFQGFPGQGPPGTLVTGSAWAIRLRSRAKGCSTLKWIALFIAVGILAAILRSRIDGARISALGDERPRPLPSSIAATAADRPNGPIDLVFLHHSVGGAMLADRGPEQGDPTAAIYTSHPSGGGLRRDLEAAGYRVHEASYGSAVGDRIDVFDWLPKFRDSLERVLRTRFQDEVLPDDRRNRVVLFETCFQSNWFTGPGQEPGNPAGPELTLANAKASLRALLPIFAQHQEVAFVHLTASPTAPRLQGEPRWKQLARIVAGRPSQQEALTRAADLSRQFNDWVASERGWLDGYPGRNVAVFDYYDLLTGNGQSNSLLYPGDGVGYDSHPSGEGQRRAAEALLPFLNRAVRRAGITP